MTHYSMLFGTYFAALRKKKGLSQTDIQKRSGITKSALSKIERGTQVVKLEDFMYLAAAVEEDPADLMKDFGIYHSSRSV